MRIAALLSALLLVLVPVVVVALVRARRERPIWALALDLPLAVAVDLLVVLTLTRFMRLEVATFVSRGLWLAAGGYAVARFRREGKLARPEGLGRREIKTASLGALLGLVISGMGSWPYSIWDRKWHTPLTSSLRGQMLPFDNVFVKGEALHYHFTGDVYAAMVQSLSFGVLHSSLALSISHDVLFLLIGASVVLFFDGLAGKRGAIAGLAITFGALLAGPFTMGRHPRAFAIDGYSILNYLSMSFRPHDALAGLFYVGIVGSVLARVWRRATEGATPPKVADTAPALILAVAGLAISDEASLGLLGLSLGLTWLAFPDVVHPRRVPGMLIFVALLFALVAPNLAFAASLSPGAQHHAVKLVPWRSPGCYTPVLPLTTAEGRRMLLFDMGPTALAWLGGAIAFAGRRRPRTAPILALLTVFVAVSVFALTRVDVNGEALESHRFATSMLFLTPLLAASLLLRSPDEEPPAEGSRARRALSLAPIVLVILGASLGAASTISWIAGVLPRRGHRHTHFFTQENLFLLDCKDLGGTLFAPARPTYISKSIWYAYAGCQPTFSPAKRENPWAITIGNPYFDKPALKVLHRAVSADEPLPVICPRTPASPPDPVCQWARAHAPCEDLGTRLTRCTLDAKQRVSASR